MCMYMGILVFSRNYAACIIDVLVPCNSYFTFCPMVNPVLGHGI